MRDERWLKWKHRTADMVVLVLAGLLVAKW